MEHKNAKKHSNNTKRLWVNMNNGYYGSERHKKDFYYEHDMPLGLKLAKDLIKMSIEEKNYSWIPRLCFAYVWCVISFKTRRFFYWKFRSIIIWLGY